MRFCRALGSFLPFLGALSLALALGASAHRRSTSPPVTFNRDIAPIVFQYCSPCHRPGEAAPFSLLNYQDTAKFAAQIAVITRRRIMPPWLPAPSDLKFSGELHLSDEQIAVFQAWADEGMPEGDPRDLPSPPQFTPGWQLGKPASTDEVNNAGV